MGKATKKKKKTEAKKKTEQRHPKDPVLGKSISATTLIANIDSGVHRDKLTFNQLNFASRDNGIASEMVKKEDNVLVTIDLLEPDKNWPKISGSAKIAKTNTSKTCDNLTFSGLQFSSKQVERIVNLIRAEEEIMLTVTVVQGEFEFQQDAA